jgi:hypothetical protein
MAVYRSWDGITEKFRKWVAGFAALELHWDARKFVTIFRVREYPEYCLVNYLI